MQKEKQSRCREIERVDGRPGVCEEIAVPICDQNTMNGRNITPNTAPAAVTVRSATAEMDTASETTTQT